MRGGAGHRARRALLALGWACGVAQAVLLREGMALAGGSEMAWGVVLAVWLLGMATGARAGVRFGRPAAGEWGPAAMLLAALAAVVLLRAAPAVTGTVPGEVMATWRAAWIWVAAVVPVAALGGWCFPTLTAAMGGAGAAGRAWALEAAGAFAGGAAFTFALARVGSVAALAAALAVAVLVAPARGSLWIAAGGLGVAVGLALPWADRALARAGWTWAGQPGELMAWANTRQQRLELGSGPPTAAYGDGVLIATAPDPYASAPLGHLLALLHPSPRAVMCVGCLGSGVLPALLQHPLERLVIVEDDPELARRLPLWLGEDLSRALADPRVSVLGEDPVRAVARTEPVDLLLLLDGDPTTLRHHRTRSREFLRACAERLAPGGILVMRSAVSDTYLAGPGGELLATLVATLKAALPQVAGVPGEGVMLVAGSGASSPVPACEEIAGRWRRRGGGDARFDPIILSARLDPQRVAALTDFVAAADASPSTALHPRAVLLAALHAEGRSGSRVAAAAAAVLRAPGWWALAVVALGAILLVSWALARGAPAPLLAGCVGLCSMGWWMLLLGVWQAAEGSVYAEVGVLSGMFMAGVVGGARLVGWRGAPRCWLAAALAGGVGVSVAIASGMALAWPRATIVPLLAFAGACTGAAFPGLAELAGRGDERRGAGRGFAADELGAALGALSVGTFAYPWLGLRGAGVLLAAIMAAALAALLLGRHQRGAPG